MVKKRFLKAFKSLKNQKTCIYACFTSDPLPSGMKKVEGYLLSKAIGFKRVIDPVPEFIPPDLKALYHGDRFLTILEVRGELSRVFYLFSTPRPIDLEEFMKSGFALAFSLRSEEGFEALLRVIFAKKISGVRYRHRSFVNFLLSFVLSIVLSSLTGVKSIVVQAMVVGTLTFLLFIAVDYPFSILHFRGVDLVPVSKTTEKVFIVRIKRAGKEGE